MERLPLLAIMTICLTACSQGMMASSKSIQGLPTSKTSYCKNPLPLISSSLEITDLPIELQSFASLCTNIINENERHFENLDNVFRCEFTFKYSDDPNNYAEFTAEELIAMIHQILPNKGSEIIFSDLDYKCSMPFGPCSSKVYFYSKNGQLEIIFSKSTFWNEVTQNIDSLDELAWRLKHQSEYAGGLCSDNASWSIVDGKFFLMDLEPSCNNRRYNYLIAPNGKIIESKSEEYKEVDCII